jgi:hypothetical protein
VDSLKYLSGNIYDCNSILWKIVADKKDAIQFLIDKLDDTTITKTKDICKKTNLRVGDLAYLTLVFILPLPFYAVTRKQCDVISPDGCQIGVFEYIETNRNKFKEQVQTYYNGKSKNLKWVQFDSNRLTPCYIQNNIKGQYE